MDWIFERSSVNGQFYVNEFTMGVGGPFGPNFSFDVIARSEVFTSRLPGLWFKFAATVQVEVHGENMGKGGRWFIVDGLNYSPRGFCSFASSAPLPSGVTYSFEDAEHLKVDSEIASYLQLTFANWFDRESGSLVPRRQS